MFRVDRHIALGALHRIAENRHVIADDEGRDFIYSGTNSLGNRILGVFISSIENRGSAFFHIIVKDPDYIKYINRDASFLELLQGSEARFVVEYDKNNEEVRSSWIDYDSIPADYLPGPKSLCPRFDRAPTLSFTASLKGKLADAHRSTPEAANAMSTVVVRMMRRSTDFLTTQLKVRRDVLQRPAMAASYKLGFEVEMESTNAVAVESQRIANYLSDYYQFIFRGVLKEGMATVDTSSPAILKLEEDINGIYKSLEQRRMPEPDLRKQLVSSIEDSIRSFNDLPIGEGFDYMTFSNQEKPGLEHPIGVVDEGYVEAVVKPLVKKVQPTETLKEEMDHEYVIEVRKFDIDKGDGRANLVIATGPNSEEKMSVEIKATGRDKGIPYTGTRLTESEHNGSRISVMAKATRKDGVISRLDISLTE